jgi:hypothetical protein
MKDALKIAGCIVLVLLAYPVVTGLVMAWTVFVVRSGEQLLDWWGI